MVIKVIYSCLVIVLSIFFVPTGKAAEPLDENLVLTPNLESGTGWCTPNKQSARIWFFGATEHNSLACSDKNSTTLNDLYYEAQLSDGTFRHIHHSRITNDLNSQNSWLPRKELLPNVFSIPTELSGENHSILNKRGFQSIKGKPNP